MPDALISIKPIYVQQILSGIKTVEIRRRPIRIPPGTRLWIYSTRPDACVIAVTLIRKVEAGSPVNLWPQIKGMVGISEERFMAYTAGLANITVLFLGCIEKLDPALDLEEIRGVLPHFHPPQFFSWLPDGELLKLLESHPRASRI
ncbi:MAG TPA: ASCH domain-containing protein [Thermoanaerobaculia bacterium]